jgi:8-oxo-dGTP diphosphatase
MFELQSVFPLSDIVKYNIKYVSMFAQYEDKWVICHLKDTNKWDCPGGKIEEDENPIQAAMRELYEETGAVESDYIPLFIYCINSDKGLSYGIQYYCDIVEFEEIPDFEMDQIEFHKDIPFEKMKTPDVHKQLYEYINAILEKGIM